MGAADTDVDEQLKQVRSEPVSQNSESEFIQHEDGRAELRDYASISSRPFCNVERAWRCE